MLSFHSYCYFPCARWTLSFFNRIFFKKLFPCGHWVEVCWRQWGTMKEILDWSLLTTVRYHEGNITNTVTFGYFLNSPCIWGCYFIRHLKSPGEKLSPHKQKWQGCMTYTIHQIYETHRCVWRWETQHEYRSSWKAWVNKDKLLPETIIGAIFCS